MMLRGLSLLTLVAGAAAHGSMLMPPSRNSVDASPGMPWAGGQHPATGTIEPYTCNCNNGTDACNNGQACFWFTQGSSVGCATADGNGTRLPNLDHCPSERPASFDPTTMSGALLPKYITTNIDAKYGSIEDIWKYNPWRAPGKAPTADPCGMAGGNTYEVFNAGAYNATRWAKQGDLATKVLGKRTDLYQTVWHRGSTERTRWEITAQHGGGYTYQLCPADSEITEECFAASQLQFATPHQQKVIHADPTQDFMIDLIVVAEGGGSGWAINPFPYASSAPCDWNPSIYGEHCKWSCKKCGAPWWAADGACPDPQCSHHKELSNTTNYGKAFTGKTKGANTVEDYLVIPESIKAGDYVLRWRWDAEASSQIWTTCSDITIV